MRTGSATRMIFSKRGLLVSFLHFYPLSFYSFFPLLTKAMEEGDRGRVGDGNLIGNLIFEEGIHLGKDVCAPAGEMSQDIL
jgi:hypothetical protein